MDPKLRVVTRLPLEEVWREDGSSASTLRIRPLRSQDVANLLVLGPVKFVVADVGLPLTWIDPTDCYRFWSKEIKENLAAPDQKCSLDEFPGGYCYFASEWRRKEKFPIVVLERRH
jgi:hypothetical protein